MSNEVLGRLASKYGVNQDELAETVKHVVFSNSDTTDVDERDVTAILVVCEQYNLNPYLREVYAYRHNGRVVPVLAVDGWNRIANECKEFDGLEFKYSEKMVKQSYQHPYDGEVEVPECHEWVEAILYRSDRGHPTVVREYYDENYRNPFTDHNGEFILTHWQTNPKRGLRHKAQVQCYRIGMGLVGVYDEDEAQRIVRPEESNDDQIKAEPSKPKPKPKAVKKVEASPEPKEVAEPAPEKAEQNNELGEIAELDDYIQQLIDRLAETGEEAVTDYMKTRFSGANLDYVYEGVFGQKLAS